MTPAEEQGELLERLQKLVEFNDKIINDFSIAGQGVAGNIETGYLINPKANQQTGTP
jgi:hypothetical protein